MMKAILAATLCAGALATTSPARADERPSRNQPDVLLVTDITDATVKRFDAKTGAYLGVLTSTGNPDTSGPNGLIRRGRNLLVINQNFGEGLNQANGEILRFDVRTGESKGTLVPKTDPQAPFAPIGLVQGKGNVLYVADSGARDDICANEGRIATFHAVTGKFLGDLDRRGFVSEFYPRGVVFGPDHMLYVSARSCAFGGDPRPGYVLRFDVRTGVFVDVFASHDTVPNLHRPEGLVFDEHGDLWVTSFRDGTADSDRIIKLDGKTGRQVDQLVLARPQDAGGIRAFARTFAFGPHGDLFIPLSGGALAAGEIRRCNPADKVCKVITPAGGGLNAGNFVVFENSDPATLAYEGD